MAVVVVVVIGISKFECEVSNYGKAARKKPTVMYDPLDGWLGLLMIM